MNDNDLKVFVNKRIKKIEQVQDGLIFHFTDDGVYKVSFDTLGWPSYSTLEILRESVVQRRLV